MSFAGRNSALQKRATGDRGWEVGTSQASRIGIKANLTRKITNRTNTIIIVDGVIKNTINLVVQQNTLSGVGRRRSQFTPNADGIIAKRYYLGELNIISDLIPLVQGLGENWTTLFLYNIPNSANPTHVTYSGVPQAALVYSKFAPYDIIITEDSDFSLWASLTPNVTNMNSMFKDCDGLTGLGLSSWVTSSVQDMSGMFFRATAFNGVISNWDTSNVTNMTQMFRGATSFNQDLSWNTSSVVNMGAMFTDATSFNGDLSWNTSNVNIMSGMFKGATAFNGDISKWNTSNVLLMISMFEGASNFNQVT